MAVKDKQPVPSRPAPSRKVVETVGSSAYKEEKPSPLSIEGIRSGAVQSKVFKGFILLSGLVMAGGLLISGLNTGGGAPQGGARSAPSNAPVATVGNQTVTGIQLATALQRQQQYMTQFGQKTGVTDYLRTKQQALQGLTDNAATVIAAQNAGLSVSDAEVEADIDKQIGDSIKPQPGQSEAAFRRIVEAQYGSLQGAKDKIKAGITADVREGERQRLLVEKLEKQVKDASKSSEDDYKRSVTKLKLWQIVVRPKLAPLSDKAATERNNRDAKTRATALFEALKAQPTLANFVATAKKSSDDPVTKAKGGDLGWKLPSEVYAGPDASDTLSKTAGNLAGPFADASGAQTIFFIEGRKTELPKEFAKDKKKLLAAFETQQDNAAWQKKQDEYKKAQTPEIEDAALSAYQLQNVDIPEKSGYAQKQARQDAITRYQTALGDANSVETAAINFQLAQLLRDNNDRAKQQEALLAAVKAVPTDVPLRLETARALRDGGKPQDAATQLAAAATALDASPSAPSPFGGGNPDDALRAQIASEYDALKQPKLAAAQRAKIKPPTPGSAGGLGGLPPGLSINPGR